MAVQSPPSGPQSSEQQAPVVGSSRPVPAVLLTVGVILLVLVVVIVLVTLKLTNSSPADRPHLPVQPASQALVQSVSTIPARVFDAVGDPSEPVISGSSSIVPAGAPLTLHGLPAVVWVGALFCPGCAAERWALVVALSRFGTFQKLFTTMSASTDVFGNTATFSLEGAEYTSSGVALSAVEEYGNTPSSEAPAGFAPLGRLNTFQETAMKTYDRAPFAQPDQLPFIDISNQMIISGWSFSPGVLSGLTMQQIANDLSDPSAPVAQAVLGAANQIAAAICSATDQRPADVCQTSAIETTADRLGLNP